MIDPRATDAQRTLLDFFGELWRAKLFILTGAVIGAALALTFIGLARPFYKSEIVLSPANPMNGAEVSSLLADDSFFALRYLVQRVGVENSSDFMRFENTYSGPSVAAFLLKDPKIVAGLGQDLAFSFSKDDKPWTPVRLSEYLASRTRLEPVGATTLRRLTYLHPDKDFGLYFLTTIHRVTDELIRQKIRQEATQRVRYLQETTAQTANPDHKRALTTLLMEQERLRMLVSIETPYAAGVIEPASVSLKTAWPDPFIIFPGFMITGALIGYVIAGIRAAIRYQAAASERVWFKSDNSNNNYERRRGDRRLSHRDAA